MGPTSTTRPRLDRLLVLGALMVVAACSGGGDEATRSTSSAAPSTTTTLAVGGDEADATGSPTTDPEPSKPTSTTTTEPSDAGGPRTTSTTTPPTTGSSTTTTTRPPTTTTATTTTTAPTTTTTAAPPPPPTTTTTTTAPPPSGPEHGTRNTGCEQYMFDQINAARANAGAPAVLFDTGIQHVAINWSDEMAGTQTLKHNPNYADQIAEVRNYRYAAENVGRGYQNDTLFQAFMDSPGHRKNIENPVYSHVTVGCLDDSGGQLWVTQNFWGS